MKKNCRSILLANDVKAICDPFFKVTGLNAFSYTRNFPDGSRTELWSDAESFYHSFVQSKNITYDPCLYDRRYVYLVEKAAGYSDDLRKHYLQVLSDQKNIFNHDNCFIVVNKSKEIIENFIFYTPVNFECPINFYINHLQKIEEFSSKFKQQAAQMIVAVDNGKNIPTFFGKRIQGGISNKSFDDAPDDVYLTKRQMQVAHHLIEGKTAKESALLLKISPRTVESYVNEIKIKLNCRKRTELVRKLLELKASK